MRTALSISLEKIATGNEQVVFLTGDLGFNALENLKAIMGKRFVNCGVAEQNMIGLAAGLALKGFSVFCYSIAPFITLRALEQIRNDLCFHRLPVHLIGNGGGYGYGIMGGSHHALEDISLMRAMPNMNCYIPAFTEDVEPMLQIILDEKQPSYLRLSLGKSSSFASGSHAFIQLNKAANPLTTAVFLGPAVNELLYHRRFQEIASTTDIFIVKRFPLAVPEAFNDSLLKTSKLITFEEHIESGGLGEALSSWVLRNEIPLKSSKNIFARGYPSMAYGSQSFHKKENGLDGDSIVQTLLFNE